MVMFLLVVFLLVVFLWRWCFCGGVLVVVLWWRSCGGVFVWCFCGGVVVFLWWCGGILVVVCLWWCSCGGVLVVVSLRWCLCWCSCGGVVLWWCFCGGVFVVVWCFLWWCFCGGVFVVVWWCFSGGVEFVCLLPGLVGLCDPFFFSAVGPLVDLALLGFPLGRFCLEPLSICFWTLPFLEVGVLYFLHNALRAHCILPRPRTTMGFRPRWIAGTIPAASSRYLVRKKGTCSQHSAKHQKPEAFVANSVVNLCLPCKESKTYSGMPFSNSTRFGTFGLPQCGRTLGRYPFHHNGRAKAYVQCGLRRFPHEGFRWCCSGSRNHLIPSPF